MEAGVGAIMEFEKAVGYRDLIEQREGSCAQKQKMTQHATGRTRTSWLWPVDGEDAVVQVFFVRDGKLIGREHFYHEDREGGGSDVRDSGAAFSSSFTPGRPLFPRELLLQEDVEDQEVLEQWLTSQRGPEGVSCGCPGRERRRSWWSWPRRMPPMVLDQDRERIKREEGRTIGAMKEIAGSAATCTGSTGWRPTISPTPAVLSRWVPWWCLRRASPKRSDYRKFKTTNRSQGPNDYASMRGGADPSVLPRHPRSARSCTEKELGRRCWEALPRFPDRDHDGRRKGAGEHRPGGAGRTGSGYPGLRHGQG